MAEQQQIWEKSQKDDAPGEGQQPLPPHAPEDLKEERQPGEVPSPQQQQQHHPQEQHLQHEQHHQQDHTQHPQHSQEQQQAETALHVSLPFLTAFHNAQGHGMSLSPADLAVLQQQNFLFQQQAQHAQQHYESEQRDKGAQGIMQAPDAMAMHALAAVQQQAGNEQHPPMHDIDFEKERKEKRKVANREAARRMRQRRSEQLGTLSANNDGLKHENQQLQHQIAQIAAQNRDLITENAQLKDENLTLKQQLLAMKAPVNGEAVAPINS